jgi:DNA-binding transcriptional LysR family regulator
MIEGLTYELSVIAKAVQHKNLSAAAAHIGLSQPQLSRLIAKVEKELKIVLLDRSAKRKSGWTSIAAELSLCFAKGMMRVEEEVLALAQDREVQQLRIGTLEGLSSIALPFANNCLSQLKMKAIFLDVLDFKDLDALFLSNQLDLIFTVRSPSKQKFSHTIELGYQQMEKISSNENVFVLSPYEFANYKGKAHSSQLLISNSLMVRENWLKTFGGTGILPVDAKKGKGKGHYTIYLIGSELLSPTTWDKVKSAV